MKSPRITACLLLLCFFALTLRLHGEDFKPVPPAELAMKDNPKSPGDSAMILEYADFQDDNEAYETEYFRIKVFTEEGKAHGNIEIPYVKERNAISDIRARVTQPDGRIVPFNGKVYDKLVVKSKQWRFQAKTFSLPDVQAGSVIEVKFRRGWDRFFVYNNSWILQHDLFVRHATYRLLTYERWASFWMAVGLPKGREVKRTNGGLDLELQDMPAFISEKYAPPEHELKPHVEFFYAEITPDEPNKFWNHIAKDAYDKVEKFIGKRKGVEQEVAQMLQAADPSEVKLKKMYERVQKIRNLSFERTKSEQEQKKEKLKENNNVEDVLRNEYGYQKELARLMVGMARAAGMKANIVMVSQRDRVFFNKNLTDARQLSGEVAYVQDGSKEYFLDPGTPFCPFGLLPWKKTAVDAIQLSKDGGTFIKTPNPNITQAVVKRLAKLKFTDDGLEGEVALLFDGYEALEHRLSALEDDDAEYRDDLQDELKAALPSGATVKLSRIENARGSNEPLMVIFNVTLPDVSSTVGSRRLVPLSIFQAKDANPFRYEKRVHPVYFTVPFQEVDQVTLLLDGMGIETMPAEKTVSPAFGMYHTTWKQQERSVVMLRQFAINGLLFPLEYYPQLRDFYSKVANDDQDNVVLRAQAAAKK